MPTLRIDLTKLRSNAQKLIDISAADGIRLAFVTKVFCADKEMVAAIEDLNFDYLADSRLDNIERYPETDRKKLLLRLPSPSEAARVVRLCDTSLNSERATLELLAKEAASAGRVHGVVLMIDLGDLREGIFYKDTQKIEETVEYILSQPSLSLLGLGTNLTCYGSVIPTAETLQKLIDLADRLRKQYSIELPFISGGNSSSIYLLTRNSMPQEITNLRIGEALLRGEETAYQQHFANLDADVVTLEAELIEVQRKPSVPEGEIGLNAFGERFVPEDIGEHRRGIVALGRQDTDHTGLVPLDEGVAILGASSDHLILDLEKASPSLKVGDTLRFSMSYSALLSGFTSSFVCREYVRT